MTVTRLQRDGYTALRFQTERGNLWGIVRPLDETSAFVEFSEEDAALAARVYGEGEEKIAAARNRFGVRFMLSVARFTRDCFPHVKRWVFERVTGANPFVERAVEV